MRKSVCASIMSALCCFYFAIGLTLTPSAVVARPADFAASQDLQVDVDSNDDNSNGDAIEFDVDFDEIDAEKIDAADVADVVSSDSSLNETASKQEPERSKSEASSDFSVESDAEFVGEERQAEDSGDVVSADADAELTDEFEIDEKDVLGSAFSGLIPAFDSAAAKTFSFERDCAVERVGLFNAGVWLKERVEQKKVARATERAKYADSAETPDEFKTIDDFFATATEAERELVEQDKRPGDAQSWFQFARNVAKSGRLEFAKRALEESFLAETGELDASFLSNDELERDARQSGLDDAYVRLERGAFERLCLACFQYWSDSSRFDGVFERSFNGTKSERASSWTALVHAGDYGAARFCRLSLDKFVNFHRVARGRVLFGNNAEDSSGELDAYSQVASSYFERVGFGAPLAALWNADETAVEALVNSMKFTRAPYVWAELGLCYYDESRPQSLRLAIEDVLRLQYGRVPTRAQVVVAAYKQALGYYERSIALPGETFPKTDSKQRTNFSADAKTFIWRWDAKAKAPAPVLASVEYAYLFEAARLARAADKLAKENRILNKEARSLAIATTSELLTAQIGPDAARSVLGKFEAACPNLTTDELALAAQYAIRAKRCRGALIPMILLGDQGGLALFNATRSASSIVVQGASCADRRVRYEALRAVVKQNPQHDFVGSRLVVQALEWFASAQGQRVVVVLEPNSERGDNIVERLKEFGFVVKTGKTVHEMLTEIQNEADLEFAFLPDGLDSETTQRAAKALRLEQTTSETPILVGTLDEKADVFDLEADNLAGLRFYDSVVPLNVSPRLRARQAKCAEQARETIQKLQTDVMDKSDKASKRILDVRSASATSSDAGQKAKNEPDSKSKGKVNFK